MPILWRRPSAGELERLRERASSESPTYVEVGATGHSSLPDGYRHIEREVLVGAGGQAWQTAVNALKEWKAHTGAGVSVTPADEPLHEATVVVVVAPVGPLWVVAPCRVVYTTTSADRFGFAYGTLPGHPEEGEEAFHVVRDPDGAVRFEITAFSRPASLLARLGGPVSTHLQDQATRRYLDGLRSAVSLGTA